MNCPIDSTPLVISERKDIEIDYCPTCRGVWLDRGELDKIIERTPEISYSEQRQEQYSHPKDQGHQYGQTQPHAHPKKKRESFLGDLFDF